MVKQNGEEFANTLTHAAGVAASIVAMVLLLLLAIREGDPFAIVGVAVFGTTLILLYLASTLYHAVQKPEVKAKLKVFDHSAIYLLIAGTYTPFMLGVLRGGWGWSLFGVIWGLAVAGVVFKLFFTGKFPRISTSIYVAMGWLVLVAIVPMMRALSPGTLAWLFAGGVTYTAGTFFYHGQRFRYSHAVWHLFVLGGSVCHAIAVGLAL